MEHLEPPIGALLHFHDGPGLPARVVGYRWEVCEIRWHDPLYVCLYQLWRVDQPAVRLQVTQEVMDQCGRLLVRGEEG